MRLRLVLQHQPGRGSSPRSIQPFQEVEYADILHIIKFKINFIFLPI